MINAIATKISVRLFNLMTLIVFVVISMSIIFYSNYTMHQGALKVRYSNIERMIEIVTIEQIRQLHFMTQSLAQELGQRGELKQAYKSYLKTKSTSLLEQHLSDPLINGYNLAASLELLWLRSYDLNYQIIAQSSQTSSTQLQSLPENILTLLQQRKGAKKMQTYGVLWQDDMSNPYYSIVLPIGGLRPQGYLEVIINPLFNLPNIENMLQMPISLGRQDGLIRYKSKQTLGKEHFMPINYWLKGIDDNKIIEITAYANIDQLEAQSSKSNIQSVLSLLILTGFFLIVAIWLLNHFLFSPLKTMLAKLDEYETDDLVTIPDNGLQELHILAKAFNRLLVRLHQRNQDLSKLSLIDGLTGIANRRCFDDYIKQQWLYAQSSKQAISLLLIDIDHFKLYNDHYGHQQGDFCLHKVAQIIQKTVDKESDLVARYGGEEFTVVLPNTNKKDAKKIAQRIMHELHLNQLKHSESPTDPCVTISIGIGGCIPSNASIDESCLIKCTDQALYRAKEQGRNRYYLMNEA